MLMIDTQNNEVCSKFVRQKVRNCEVAETERQACRNILQEQF
jgi:hypothetical protein